MFIKKERLSRAEFNQFFKTGKRINFPEATFIVDTHSECKVSVVVGKKVSKSAVRRNTLRRRVYALLKEELKNNNFKGVVIVILKPGFNSLTKTAAADFVRSSIAEVIKSA